MWTVLRVGEPADAAGLAALFDRRQAIPEHIEAAAREIIAAVRAGGDAALRELTQRFEGRALEAIEIPTRVWHETAKHTPPEVVAAIEHAVRRVTAFHEKQRESGYHLHDEGVDLALRVDPLARVGLYVPGGTARYPSSVIMTAVPARVAGVAEIVMVTPGPSPETLAAARAAGVDRVLAIGGAQAIAALAYGTESVPRVDKIVGPGNAYVAAAKRLVFGDVDIDSIAGPTEVLIVADDSAPAAVLAADLLAQAEHDAMAIPVLVTTHEEHARSVAEALEDQLADLPRRDIARRALQNGACVIAPDVPAAIGLANQFAPEHLGLHIRDAASWVDAVRSAGAVFVGPHTPEAAGDYLAGPNHVLPTGGAARYASPLGVHDYVKRISVITYTQKGLARHAEDIVRLARVEGLEAHARSVLVRTGGDPS